MNNILIDDKNKEVIINLNTVFYPEAFIIKTAEKFENFCWINLSGNSDKCVNVSLKPKDDAISYDKVGFEFMNHLLATIKDAEGV